MRKLKSLLILFAVIILANVNSYDVIAQVTVGSDKKPAKAALLEIKSDEDPAPSAVNHTSNVTSNKGGLGLPRVRLVDKTTLEPFITTSSTEWTTDQAMTKIKHAGLMVYNINVTTTDPTDPAYPTNKDKRLKQGVYVWDGAKWTLVGEGSGEKYFYIPSFNIKLDPAKIGTTDKVDLYEQYMKQFTNNTTNPGDPDYNPLFVTNSDSQVFAQGSTVPSPENGTLYTREELDYVITYYDKDVIEDLSILDTDSGGDERGTLFFKLKSTETTPNSFMNVVFVIRE